MFKFNVLVFVFAWQCACTYVACDDQIFAKSPALVGYFTDKWYKHTFAKVMNLLNTPQIPERYVVWNEKIIKYADEKPLSAFNWNNCDGTSDPVKINALTLSPDPLQLPGDVNLSFDISSSINITAPLEVSLNIKKWFLFFWITVPCVQGGGSCTYSDICSILPSQCPSEFIKYNIPCTCPVSQGNYVLPESRISLPSLPVPSWLTHGDYSIKVVGKLSGKEAFCFYVNPTIS